MTKGWCHPGPPCDESEPAAGRHPAWERRRPGSPVLAWFLEGLLLVVAALWASAAAARVPMMTRRKKTKKTSHLPLEEES